MSQSESREGDKRCRHTLVTEDATPAVFAVTLERLAARSVQAARILDAAITMRSFPSESASDLSGKSCLQAQEATKGTVSQMID